MSYSKLYKKYFPIASEEEKEKFIKDNLKELFKLVERYEKRCDKNLYYVEYQTEKLLKPEMSLLGRIKYKNIVYNQTILDYHDSILKRCQEKSDALWLLHQNLVHKNYEQITIETLNLFLLNPMGVLFK